MGVKGLNNYVKNNIRAKYDKWIINKKKYKSLISSNCINEDETSENPSLFLVVDALAYFYHLANQLNWFVYDNLSLLNLLKKHLHYLLAIDNLKKIVFIFDGVNLPIKRETEFIRRNEKINAVKNFHNFIVQSQKLLEKYSPGNITPSPLVLMIYIQFLKDFEKTYKNMEVKFSLLEADSYISKLANNYNGFIISNDSDFFIYKTPGYINVNSLEFPENFNDNDINGIDFIIKFETYTRTSILNHFCLSEDTLPIFASLCGNDYLKIDNYSRLKLHFKYYNKTTRRSTNSINYFIYKNIVNFILDMKDRVKLNETPKLDKYNNLTLLQKLIIEKICEFKPRESSNELNEDFKEKLIESVRQYHNETTVENKQNNNNNSLIYNEILENLEDSIKSNILNLSEEILKDYYEGKIFPQLLNVLINNQFDCTQYFEDISKQCCWNITEDLRDKMYILIMQRNFIQGLPSNANNVLEEIIRNNEAIVIKNIIIQSSSSKKFDALSVDNNFTEYLNLFKSNITQVKELPYFLIPLVSSLRFFLNEKINTNSFIYKNNKKIYSHFSNGSYNINMSNTILHHYELEAIIASSIAALTFTYLNISNYLIKKNKIFDNKSLNSISITNNVNENNNPNCDNIYKNLKICKGRSLQLKSNWNIENLKKNKTQFENAIQIYAEFCNVLIMNSYFLQVLKLLSDIPEFYSFYSMYHYQWEEAYYNMIELFKISRDNKISSIFNNVFSINDTKENCFHYINYLDDIYSVILNTVVNN